MTQLQNQSLLEASMAMGRAFLPATALVPIRALGENERERIAVHLLALDEHDRYLRFGVSDNDDQIRRYVAALDFERDEIFGIYNRRLELLAMAHVAFTSEPGCPACAEFGVSVLPKARGRGYGARLFDTAIMHARNEGVSLMYIHVLSENDAMLKIARNAGATVVRDGAESEAYLKLPAADMDSRMHAMIDDQVAEIDYALKVQMQQFTQLMGLQRARPTAAQTAAPRD
jgi:GNAT superfamily N-acetyltransferase